MRLTNYLKTSTLKTLKTYFKTLSKSLHMKNLIICLVAVMCCVQVGLTQRFSQDDRDALRERVEAQRIAFITQKLELSPEESEKFWPVYNAYKQAQEEKRKSVRPDKPISDLTDDEARSIIARHLDVEAEMVDLIGISTQKRYL